LKILKALIERSSRDLPLYAPYVLTILAYVLRSEDISMVEESIPTFQTYCEHQDVATLAADQEQIRQYEELVKLYARYAGWMTQKARGTLSAPMAIRWRNAGLQGIKSVCGTEAIGADGGRQLGIVMPAILQNLDFDSADHLDALHVRAHATEKIEQETAVKRRMSIATVRTVDTTPEANLATVSATTADADRIAEEEVGLLALQSLKEIFIANNRARIRLATVELLSFVGSRIPLRPDTAKSVKSGRAGSWAMYLLEIVTKWSPVQDRFVILVTVMETLVRSPTAEGNLEQQLVLASLVDGLLSSSINMIGLSVMDVLLGLVQHVLLLLQLGGRGSSILPHHQQTDAIDLFQETKPLLGHQSKADLAQNDGPEHVSSPSTNRQELLKCLQRCIGDLATHVYYSDQVSDMIAALLLRLKPSASSAVATAVAAIDRPAAAAQAISNSAKLREDPNTDEFFSFGTARVTALNAIKDILIVANKRGSSSGATATDRNRVGVQIWEGTEWLLRDEDRRVRRAYVGSLMTWLRLEMSPVDLRAVDNDTQSVKGLLKPNGGQFERANSLNRRAVSNSSHRGKGQKTTRTTFVQLLHLAVYDNALECSDSVSELLLLHLLLATLVDKLGVNSAKSGLPMIMRLQEDLADSKVDDPVSKINIGSLVHGYLWTLCDKFDLDATRVGYDIHSEVTRRRKSGLWLDVVRVPPLALEQIATARSTLVNETSLKALEQEPLKQFEALPSLVTQISIAYSAALASPPTSPSSSPSRVFGMPVLSPVSQSTSSLHELPASTRDTMLTKWSKESCIAATEKETAGSSSLHGSRTGTTQSANGFLAANGHTPRDSSPSGLVSTQLAAQRHRAKELTGQPAETQRRASAQGTDPPTPVSSSDCQPTLRVDDLKRVLAGGAFAEAWQRSAGSGIRGASPLRNTSTAYQDIRHSRQGSISVDSNSIVDAEGFESASEGDLAHPLPPPQSPLNITEVAEQLNRQASQRPYERNESQTKPDSRPPSRDQSKIRRRSTSSASGEDPAANVKALKGLLILPPSRGSGTSVGDDVPPMPPLPKNLPMRNNVGATGRMNTARTANNETILPPMAPDNAEKIPVQDSSLHEASHEGILKNSVVGERRNLVQELLNGIQVGEVGLGKGMGKPPY
jgi:hypothetical protein